MEISKIKLIAYYLPQFYEIEFNNKYWGKGYTEWTATAKAKPLFSGHYQPHIPADLGFYNLLMPETRVAQANMAREYGVDGFCYWHYWFGNHDLMMEKPYQFIIEQREPNFPFCLCWANHTWHNPLTKEQIKSQFYPGKEDYIAHFNYLLKGFKDNRYMKTANGRLIFGIFDPLGIPNMLEFKDIWNLLAKENGFEGFYFVGICQHQEDFDEISKSGVDAVNSVRLYDFLPHQNQWKEYLKYKFGPGFHDYEYSDAAEYFVAEDDKKEEIVPTIITGWDHSPRSGKNGLILKNYTPEAFEKHLRATFNVINKKDNKLCFIKAWNEWGEGNHLEPDLKYGLRFLETLKKVKDEFQK